MAVETFVSHRKYLWMWVNLFFVAGFIVIYAFLKPAGGHAGDTGYGYFLGTIATLGIAHLMWYGIRKRSYHSANSTLKGWLAAHIWLGVSLLIIVPLHSGFSFGWNIHSIAYYLMVIVIVSGIWGAFNYRRLAREISSNQGGEKFSTLIEQIEILSERIKKLSSDKTGAFVQFVDRMDFPFRAQMIPLLLRPIPSAAATEDIQASMSKLSEEEKQASIEFIKLIEKKRDFAQRVQKELRTMAALKLWLLIHLPVSIALVVAVIIHIFSVFYYR